MEKYYYRILDIDTIECINELYNDNNSYLSYLPKDMINIIKEYCKVYYHNFIKDEQFKFEKLVEYFHTTPSKYHYLETNATDTPAPTIFTLKKDLNRMKYLFEVIDIEQLLFRTIINNKVEYVKLKKIFFDYFLMSNTSISISFELKSIQPLFVEPYKFIRAVYDDIQLIEKMK